MLAARYTLKRFSPNSQPRPSASARWNPMNGLRADVEAQPDRQGLADRRVVLGAISIDGRRQAARSASAFRRARPTVQARSRPALSGDSDLGEREVARRDELAVGGDAAGNLDEPTEPADDLGRRLKQDARPRRGRELEVVQRRQSQRLRHGVRRQCDRQSAGLREQFDQRNRRNDRVRGKVPVEVPVIGMGDARRARSVPGNDLDDLLDESHRRPMRQLRQKVVQFAQTSARLYVQRLARTGGRSPARLGYS